MRKMGRVLMLVPAVCCLTGLLWAQGNPCQDPIATGGSGCGINPIAVTHGTLGMNGAGIDFAGTEYDDGCSWCPDPNQPLMRFWEHNHFLERNSGTARQTGAGVQWMVNPANDGGVGVGSNIWAIKSANWANVNVEGCINDSSDPVPVNVTEISFCDAATGRAYYVAAGSGAPGPFDLDYIEDAGGAAGNLLPLTPVPVPLPLCNSLSVGAGTCQIDLSAVGTLPDFHDAEAAGVQLVRGLEILYKTGTAAPTPECAVGLSTSEGDWTPVLKPDHSGPLGPVTVGTVHTVGVPDPADPPVERTWFSARVVYVDAGSDCGLADPCPDPQTHGTPASCFLEISNSVGWGSGVTGACCTPVDCHQSLETPCAFGGGVWAGADTDCLTVPSLCPARMYQSVDPANVVDPANAVDMVVSNPHPVPWEPSSPLYYALDDGTGAPDLIRLSKGFLNILIHY